MLYFTCWSGMTPDPEVTKVLKLSEILRKAGRTDAQVREELSGEISEYQGKPVKPAIVYNFDPDQYENMAEAKQSEDWPGENQIFKLVNQKLVTSAKSAAYQEKTKDLKKEYESSPEFKRKNLVSSLVAAGKSQDEAEKLADSLMA